jgi:thioredoxin-like negative regulator of GroEL
MAPIGIFITILAILALNNASDEYGSNVIILDDNNFDKEVITNSATDWLILFYAPWCKYCKEVMPIYEQIANDLLGKTYLAKVDVMAPGNRQLGINF